MVVLHCIRACWSGWKSLKIHYIYKDGYLEFTKYAYPVFRVDSSLVLESLAFIHLSVG